MLADIIFLLPNSISNLQLCSYTSHMSEKTGFTISACLYCLSPLIYVDASEVPLVPRGKQSMACHLKTLSLISLSIPASFSSPWTLYLNHEHTMILSMPGPLYLLLCLLRMYFLCLNNSLNFFINQLKCCCLLSLVWIIYPNHHHMHP